MVLTDRSRLMRLCFAATKDTKGGHLHDRSVQKHYLAATTFPMLQSRFYFAWCLTRAHLSAHVHIFPIHLCPASNNTIASPRAQAMARAVSLQDAHQNSHTNEKRLVWRHSLHVSKSKI